MKTCYRCHKNEIEVNFIYKDLTFLPIFMIGITLPNYKLIEPFFMICSYYIMQVLT